MTVSDATTESHLARIALAIAGCKQHGSELPPEAAEAKAELERRHAAVVGLAAEQEQIRSSLAQIGDRINNELREAARARAELLRFAEETYGPRDERMRAFRPASEARLHAPRLSRQPARDPAGAGPTASAAQP